MIDWESAYDNRAAVPGAERVPEIWAEAAQAARVALAERCRALSYGPHPRQLVHLMLPEAAPAGLAIFFHGGYWMRNDPTIFLHLGAGALARGWAVAMPGYRLCPEVPISEIVKDAGAAVALAAQQVPGPIRLAGHSAGGQLAARLGCAGAVPEWVAARLSGLVSISGLHDLRPLRRTPMQSTLRLTSAEALSESPAFCEPIPGLSTTAWVGSGELAELRRQSRLLVELWGGLGAPVRLVEDAGQDHFTVIDALADPQSPLTGAWLS
ncbi:MAG: alpha/beta hydrolase [Pikeienuella sp.]